VVRSTDVIARSFAVGESDLMELIDARRVLLEVRRQSLAADLRLRLDCESLRILSREVEP